MTQPLFEPEYTIDRTALSERLRELAQKRIWIGTSSWKYYGWLGQIYTYERYDSRGKFSRKKFEAECLREYAEVFPAVGGDFTFYRYPSENTWTNLFEASPETLQFVFKAPEEVTVDVFPRHDRYGARAGTENPAYMSAAVFESLFLRPLEMYRQRVGPIVFEFGPRRVPLRRFVADLDKFLGALPDRFRYAVEVRNPDYFDPRYFECLKAHNVAHVFNAWTKTPPLADQVALEDAFTADIIVSRALLSHEFNYEDAVNTYQPYSEIRKKDPGARGALRELIARAQADGRAAYILVNNRLEGNAPETIRSIISGDAREDVDQDEGDSKNETSASSGEAPSAESSQPEQG